MGTSSANARLAPRAITNTHRKIPEMYARRMATLVVRRRPWRAMSNQVRKNKPDPSLEGSGIRKTGT
jgi:hypothetical protein